MATTLPPFPTPSSPSEAATDEIRRYCGWHVAPEIDDTVTLEGTPGAVLILPTLHLISLTSITIDGVAVDLGGVTPREDGRLLRHGGWGSRWRTVVVQMRHGFDAASELGQLVADVVARANASPAGATSVRVGNVQTTAAQVAPGVSGGVVLMGHERAKLDAYRIFRA